MPKVGYKFSPEQLQRLSEGHKGQIAWNTGKKMCDHPLEYYKRSSFGRPYCLLCHREHGAQYRQKNQKQINAKGRLARYHITVEDFNSMWKHQQGLCAVCATPLDIHQYKIDHDHSNGKVRGLLCNSCNAAIGLLKDSPALALKAVRYLNDHSH